MTTTPFRRADLASGEILCDHCPAKCCRYFALPIETPTDRGDFEHIRWYLLHADVSVFVEDDGWFLLIHNECDQLNADHRCDIYTDRPTICRSYSTANCEFDEDACYDRLFEHPEQIDEFADALLGRRRRGKLASLPVLGAVS